MRDVRTIVVADYDEEWPRIFEELSSVVRRAVGDIAVAIEHVGSTAVPGLAAKPVVDMDLVVEETDVATAIERLAGIGYEHRGDLGIPMREAFGAPGGTPEHNLYVCPRQSPALANHIALRDHLRADPDAARAYGELKRRLAEEFPHDIDGYIEGKTGFITAILRQAGFPDDALTEIERRNRRR